MAKSWKDDANEAGGDFLKFKDGTEYVLYFVSGPKPHSFEAQDGKTVKGWEWQVELDGETKTLSVTSKRLLRVLSEEDDDEELIGRSVKIKALGDGMARQWRVVPANTRKRMKQEAVVEEEEDEEPEEKPKSVPKKAKPTGTVEEVESVEEFEAAAARRGSRPRGGRKKKVQTEEEYE
jgi:hypothetical protein